MKIFRESSKNFSLKKTLVYITGNSVRHSATSATDADRTDDKLNGRINAFKDNIFKKDYYKLPLGFLVDLGLINSAQKSDTKFVFTLERNMNKLFKSKKKVTEIPDDPDALI